MKTVLLVFAIYKQSKYFCKKQQLITRTLIMFTIFLLACSIYRSKALGTVERILHPEVFLERVVYDLDYLLAAEDSRQVTVTPGPPRSVSVIQYSTYILAKSRQYFLAHDIVSLMKCHYYFIYWPQAS